MHPSLSNLCAAIAVLELEEQAIMRGEHAPGTEREIKRLAVVRAARAAAPALECLKAGVQPKTITVQAEAFGYARGASDRARMEALA